MAESLGAAVLTVSVDDAQLKAGLRAAEQQAAATGRAVEQAFTRTGKPLQTAANGLQFFVDAQGRARSASGQFLTTAQLQAAGIERVGAAAQRSSSGIASLAGAFAGLGIGAAGIGFLRGSVNAAVELETITKKLSNTLGAQGAGQALSFTKGLSDQLGLSFKTLANSFGSFTAAATAANVPLSQQKDLFSAVSKAAQALGLSNDEINGSLLALQQVAAKGTVSAEELRGQLGERLPIALAAAARGLGITQQELLKLVESGRLTASEFFPALTKGLNELTAGAGGTETAAQNFQKLANAFDELQTSFGQSILPFVTEQVKNLTGALEGVGVVLRANKLGLGGGAITNAFGIIPEQGAEAVGALKALQTQFSLTEQQANALFTDAVASVGGRTNAFGQLALSADQFKRVLEKLPSLAEQFRAKNKDVTGELNAQNAEAARLLQEELKRRDSVVNLQGALRSLTEEQKNLAVDSQRYADINEEIIAKQNRLNELKKTEGQRFAENIAAANQLRSIQEEIAIQQQRGDLTGTGIGALNAVKQFEDAKRAEQDAQAALRANPGSSDLLNASKVASENVKLAAAKTKADLQDAFKSAQDAVQSISRGIEDSVTALRELQNSSGGLNQFLSPQQQVNRQQAVADQLRPEANALANQLGIRLQVSGTTQERNQQTLDFIKAARQELRLGQDIDRAQVDLGKATNDLAVVNDSLVTVNTQLTEATTALAQKDWQVNVAVNANTGEFAVNLG